MKIVYIFIALLISFMTAVPASIAGDFDWMKDFSVKAEADPSGFRAQLGARFKIGDAEINAVLSNVDNSADAYMALRLGEMSGKPTEEVIEKYKAEKRKGWGSLAKSLGIKPGSKEFRALKNGDDLYGSERDSKSKGKGKGKEKKK
jgi:hypothetical protein